MQRPRIMQRISRWHIWLGWLVGLPVLMWTVTGLVMVAKPIEEVRGNHLRKQVPERALPADTEIAVSLPAESTRPVRARITRLRNWPASFCTRLPKFGSRPARPPVEGGCRILPLFYPAPS